MENGSRDYLHSGILNNIFAYKSRFVSNKIRLTLLTSGNLFILHGLKQLMIPTCYKEIL